MVFGVFMVDSDRKTHPDDAPEFAEVVFFPPCTDPRSLYNLILFHHVHLLFNFTQNILDRRKMPSEVFTDPQAHYHCPKASGLVP